MEKASGLAVLRRLRPGTVSLLAVFVLLGALSIQKIWAADIWWQLRTGQWILEHHALPAHDVFSYTASGNEWVEMRWLFCVGAYLVWSVGGPSLAILLQTAILAFVVWLFIAPVLRTAETLPGTAVLIAGVVSAASRFVFRPEIVSYLCVAVFLVVLHGHDRGRYRKAVWLLPILQIFWTNAHTVFVFGPFLAWTFAGGAIVRSLWVRFARARQSRGAGILATTPGKRRNKGRVQGAPHTQAPVPTAQHKATSVPNTPRGASDSSAGPTRRGASDSPVGSSRADGFATAGGQLPRSAGGQPPSSTGVWKLALLASLVTAACWINPYFHRGAMFPLILFREIHKGSILSTTIMEFRSPISIEHWSWDLYAAVALVVMTAATFLLNWRRTDPARLVIWAAYLYFGCVSVRNVAPLGFVAIWATLHNLDEIRAARREARGRQRGGTAASAKSSGHATSPSTADRVGLPARNAPAMGLILEGQLDDPSAAGRVGTSGRRATFFGRILERTPGTPSGLAQSPDPPSDLQRSPGFPSRLAVAARLGLAALVLIASWYVVSDRFYVRMGAPRRFGLGVIDWHTPAGATAFLLENHALPQAFHSMSDGSYLTWAAAGRYPVYIDGRLEVYGEHFIERYFRLGDTDWEHFADAAGINTAILERTYFGTLVGVVNASPRWALVYIDARDLVFVRNIPEHAELIRKYRIDPRAPYVPRAPEPEERPAGWRRLIGSVEQPWYSFAMARSFLALGSLANAERFLKLGLERFPDHPGMKKALNEVRTRTVRPVIQAGPD